MTTNGIQFEFWSRVPRRAVWLKRPCRQAVVALESLESRINLSPALVLLTEAPVGSSDSIAAQIEVRSEIESVGQEGLAHEVVADVGATARTASASLGVAINAGVTGDVIAETPDLILSEPPLVGEAMLSAESQTSASKGLSVAAEIQLATAGVTIGGDQETSSSGASGSVSVGTEPTSVNVSGNLSVTTGSSGDDGGSNVITVPPVSGDPEGDIPTSDSGSDANDETNQGTSAVDASGSASAGTDLPSVNAGGNLSVTTGSSSNDSGNNDNTVPSVSDDPGAGSPSSGTDNDARDGTDQTTFTGDASVNVSVGTIPTSENVTGDLSVPAGENDNGGDGTNSVAPVPLVGVDQETNIPTSESFTEESASRSNRTTTAAAAKADTSPSSEMTVEFKNDSERSVANSLEKAELPSENSVVPAAADLLFSRFQRELLEATGVAAAIRYVRLTTDQRASSGQHGEAEDDVSNGFSYSQITALIGILACAGSQLLKKMPEDKLRWPLRVGSNGRAIERRRCPVSRADTV